jgi:DNA-directed RNA polymerase specialized sigma24 family protein
LPASAKCFYLLVAENRDFLPRFAGDLFRQKKFLEQLTKCLAALSPNLANAFTLREIDGADTKEICKVLRVTETNLWVILHRARARLRECLETHWLGRSPEVET